MTAAPPLDVVRVRSTRDVLVPVTADYLLSHLGFFTILPVLPLVVQRFSGELGPFFVGAVLFVFTFAIRGASLFCAPLIHRAAIDRSMAAGLCLAALGFLGLAIQPPAPGVIAFLVLAGTGISVNGLAARVFVAKMLAHSAQRNVVFSAVQVVVNVAAAVGPVLGNLLFGKGLLTFLLSGVALAYFAAAVTVAATIPSGLRPSTGEIRPPARLGPHHRFQRGKSRRVHPQRDMRGALADRRHCSNPPTPSGWNRADTLLAPRASALRREFRAHGHRGFGLWRSARRSRGLLPRGDVRHADGGHGVCGSSRDSPARRIVQPASSCGDARRVARVVLGRSVVPARSVPWCGEPLLDRPGCFRGSSSGRVSTGADLMKAWPSRGGRGGTVD
ncbi:MAG: MFS transporter [Acidothermus sp.]|nr:MFS transporter [Acidothermus sp.]